MSIIINEENIIKLNEFRDQVNIAKLEYMLEHLVSRYIGYYNDHGIDHGTQHINDVLNRSIKIFIWWVNKLGIKSAKESEELRNLGIKSFGGAILILIFASIIHDFKQHLDRKNHHKLAAEELINLINWSVYLQSINNFKWITRISKNNLYIASKVCMEHRSSFEGEFSNILCEIFNAADNDPLNLKTTIQRSYSYTKDRNPELNNAQVKDQVIMHLEDKFSRSGYMFKNLKNAEFQIFMEYYKNDLEVFWNSIDKIIVNRYLIDKYL